MAVLRALKASSGEVPSHSGQWEHPWNESPGDSLDRQNSCLNIEDLGCSDECMVNHDSPLPSTGPKLV